MKIVVIDGTGLIASKTVAILRQGGHEVDLGSDGGIDVLLSTCRFGPSSKAYGLEMTDDMLAFARENQPKAGARNVEFLVVDREARR